jgi:amino acid transporter
VWITVIIVLLLFLNVWAVGLYGETEFCFASIKIITIVGLLILAVVIILGGGPNHDRLGFRYWDNPGGKAIPFRWQISCADARMKP